MGEEWGMAGEGEEDMPGLTRRTTGSAKDDWFLANGTACLPQG
jgi:hypothetical protein